MSLYCGSKGRIEHQAQAPKEYRPEGRRGAIEEEEKITGRLSNYDNSN